MEKSHKEAGCLENGDGFRGSRLSGLRVSFTAGRNVSLNLSNQTARVSIPSNVAECPNTPFYAASLNFFAKRYFVLNHRPGPSVRPEDAEQSRKRG
jgi:hypothetical protein